VCFDILYICRPKHSQFYEEFSEIWSNMYIGVHVKYRYCCLIFMTLEPFIDRFAKNNKTLNFTKIRQVGAELFRADRQADMAKLIAALRNPANALENALFTQNIFPYNSYGFTGNRRQLTVCAHNTVTKRSCSAISSDYSSHLNLQTCKQHKYVYKNITAYTYINTLQSLQVNTIFWSHSNKHSSQICVLSHARTHARTGQF
jgi:hypothetical protein